jgi:transcriptional regulator with XRE-family HTH domain
MKHGHQTKLAKTIGYKNPAAISLIYGGNRRPSILFAKRLAKETKTTLDFWLDTETSLQKIQHVLDSWREK